MALLRVPPQQFDYLSPEESELLLSDRKEPIWHEMILLALRTGMRHGELIGLDWSDIDFSHQMITVRQSIVDGIVSSPKNNRIRYIPMTDELSSALLHRRQKSGLVFTRPDGRPLSYSIAWNSIRRVCKRVGLRLIGWHVLRHTFASQLAAQGVQMRTIQELLGHATIQMTSRYAHVSTSMLRDAVELLRQQAVNTDKILSEMFR